MLKTALKKTETTELLKDRGAGRHLKITQPRAIILEAFLKNDHVTAEGLYDQLTQKNIHLGLATVYRTLNLLCEIGVGQQRHFGDSKVLYDNVLNKKHHDHLICNQCGRIVEFECPDIEKLQEAMAKKYGFVLQQHRLELYGVCKDTDACSKRAQQKN